MSRIEPKNLNAALTQTALYNPSDPSQAFKIVSLLYNDFKTLADAINAGAGFEIVELTLSELREATLVLGTTYKVTNPIGGTNPIYFTYQANRGYQSGVMEIYNATLDRNFYVYVTYIYEAVLTTNGEDKITSLYDPIESNRCDGLTGSGFISIPNTIETIIDLIANKEFTISNYGNYIGNDCTLDIPDLGGASFLFYENYIPNANILTIASTPGPAVFLYNYFWWQNTLTVGTGCDIRSCIFYNNTTVTIGDGALIKNARFYDGVTISIPAGKTFNDPLKSYEAKPNTNTFNDIFDVEADTTPDLTAAAWAGEIELGCTAASISLTSLIGLQDGFTYKFTIAAGKTITFTNGANIRCLGGADFVGVGSSADFIIVKMSSGVATAQIQAKH